jgi:hypothetical protein
MVKHKLEVCYPPGLKDLKLPWGIYKDARDVLFVFKDLGWKAYNFQIIDKIVDKPIATRHNLQERVENALYVLENHRLVFRNDDGIYEVSDFSRRDI